ncbi:MAG: acyltransferase family protein [Rhodomicrobium sp.]
MVNSSLSPSDTRQKNNPATAGRLKFLDGLRGIAITGVVLYHTFSRWPELLPSAARYNKVAIFLYGGYGVELFFMISGFVILMTLEKCASFYSFMFRRWVRLFPAMLFCSVIIYATAPLLPERPLGAVVLRDILPGLTFLQQDVWESLLGPGQGIVEASFWTLFVEMKFYVLFGAVYFAIGAEIAIITLISLFSLHSAVVVLHFLWKNTSFPVIDFVQVLLNGLSAEYYGWFAAGACFYLYFKDKNRNWAYYGAGVTLLSAALFKGSHVDLKVASLLFGALFILAMMSGSFRKLLGAPILVFVGFISYPLYLMHENMVVALSIRLTHWAPLVPSLLLPVIPICLVGGLAWFVAKYIEPQARLALRTNFLGTYAILLRKPPLPSCTVAGKHIGNAGASD